jgi:hypothetical protein
MSTTTKQVSRTVPAEFASYEPADHKTFMTCWCVTMVILALPENVDQAREVMRIANKVMAYKHGDHGKYTAEEWDQYLNGKNPHGLKSKIGTRRRAKLAKRKAS